MTIGNWHMLLNVFLVQLKNVLCPVNTIQSARIQIRYYSWSFDFLLWKQTDSASQNLHYCWKNRFSGTHDDRTWTMNMIWSRQIYIIMYKHYHIERSIFYFFKLWLSICVYEWLPIHTYSNTNKISHKLWLINLVPYWHCHSQSQRYVLGF